MNHRYYSVNVSNSNIGKRESTSSQGVILEKEFKEIYNTQYNDLFPKILTKSKSDFISLLKSQVSLHLKIISKTAPNAFNTKYLDIFTKKFFVDKSKTTKGLEDILKNPDLQKNYLQLVNCYIHCHKCTKISHVCKNNLISYKGYIYCIHCQKVYNENQIKLYCDECKTCYYSKIRYMLNKKYENFFHVCFKEYHCNIDEEEKIKCLECGHDLYYNIAYDKKNLKKNGISEIFCLKCKLLFDLNEVFFQCKKCNKNFKSEAKIYNNFSHLKNQFLLIMHCLRKKKYALPEKRNSRKCKCDLSKFEKYSHEEDNGILYLGHNLKGEYIILCDTCYTIFNYNDFVWKCPECKINFKSKKNLYQKNYVRTLNYFGEKIGTKIEKNPTIYKSPSNVNIIHRKTIIEAIPSSAGDKENNSNIVKNLFCKNNNLIQTAQKSSRNSNKFNHITKVIMLTTNKKIKTNNMNLSEQKDQKMHLFKKLKNINIKNNSNYHTTVNEPKKYIDIKKANIKSFSKNKNYTNNNTLNNALNNISYTNNKSDCNTNKCNDSTNITSPNYENINETNNSNNELDKGVSLIIKHDSNNAHNPNNNNNNKIIRKLVYNDVIEKEKNQDKKNEKQTKDKIINQKIKEINTNKNEKQIEKLCASSKKNQRAIKYIMERKDIKSNENLEIKKVNTSIFDKFNKSKDLLLDSVDEKNNVKKNNYLLNKTNDNIDIKINNKDSKIKNIKSMRNIRSINNNLRIKNLKTSNNVKTSIITSNNLQNKQIKPPIKTALNSKNKLKLEKSMRNVKEKIKINDVNINIEKNNNINNNINNNNAINNKRNNNKEKKQIARCATQFKLQNIRNNNPKGNSNSIFKKIKEYYDNCRNEESSIFNESKRPKNNDTKLNKSIVPTTKKKIVYKTNFNSDNYTTLKLLGKGTYGKTYLVEDPKTKERFALKKITINDKIELKENQDEYNLILKLTKEFPELKIINIYGIEIKKLDKYNTVMYVLMEAAKCDWEKEIMNHLELGSYYKEEQLMDILYNLVKSFSILQKKGICHRDVKPQNILCFENNEYKISDFGEAKNFKKNMINNNNSNKKYSKENYKYNIEGNTMEQTLRGTELYMSPILFQALRQRMNQSVTYNSYKSDVFSLGMCFFLASSLSYEGLYEVREIVRYKDKTRLVVNRYLSLKYSQKYINVLISMLQINENDRPDFIELEKILDNL